MLMTRSLSWLLVALLLLAGGARAEDPDPAASRWNDKEFLASLLAPACDAIEQVQGVTYPKRPTIAFSSKQELAELLVEEMGGIFRRVGATDDAQVSKMARDVAGMLAAKYAPATNVVHVLVENVERLTRLMGAEELRTEGVMRMLMIHECAHALDFQRYPALEELRHTRETPDGIQAVGAIIEGHAQLVTEKVAERLGAQADFEAFTRFVTFVPGIEDPAQRLIAQVMAAEVQFAYVQGHRFLRAVEKARGREGIAEVLRAPPAETRLIDNPEQYLEPTRSAEPEFKRFLDAMGALAQESWSTQVVPLKRGQVRAALGVLPAEILTPLLESYVDGVAWVGTTGDGGQVIAALMQWRDDESAARYLRDMRQLHALKDEQFKSGAIRIVSAEYLDGAGLGNRSPGLRANKTLDTGGEVQLVCVHHATYGRFGIEVTFILPESAAGASFDTWTDRALVAAGASAPEPAEAK